MKKTLNYNLNKPGYDDAVDIEVLNENMDIVDSALKDKMEASDLNELEQRLQESLGSAYHVGPLPPKNTGKLWIDTSELMKGVEE